MEPRREDFVDSVELDQDARFSRICDELLDYVKAHHAANFSERVTVRTHLLECGLVDSLSMMTFILHLEHRYSMDFMVVDITRNEFASVETLARFVVANLGDT